MLHIIITGMRARARCVKREKVIKFTSSAKRRLATCLSDECGTRESYRASGGNTHRVSEVRDGYGRNGTPRTRKKIDRGEAAASATGNDVIERAKGRKRDDDRDRET